MDLGLVWWGNRLEIARNWNHKRNRKCVLCSNSDSVARLILIRLLVKLSLKNCFFSSILLLPLRIQLSCFDRFFLRVFIGGFCVVFVDMDFGSLNEDVSGEFAEKDPTGRYVRVWILVNFVWISQLQLMDFFYAILIYDFVNLIPILAELLVLSWHCIAARLTCRL